MFRGILTKTFVLAVLVAGFTLLPSAKAEATFAAYICDNQACSGTVVAVADQNTGSLGGGVDASGTAGSIVLVGASIGGMSVILNSSLSKPLLAQPIMDLAFQTSGAGEVWLYTTDQGFNVVLPLIGTIDGNFVGGSGEVEAFVYGGDDNSFFNLTPQLGTSGVLTSSSFNAVFPSGSPTANPYSYTLGVRISSTGGAVSGDFGVSAVPEPASLFLLGAGLTGVRAAYRRRRRAQA